MKKIILLNLLCMPVFAGDLVFKHGFEATALVSGTATGVTSSGLTINLNVGSNNEILAVSDNGAFTFFMSVNFGASYQVSIQTLPSSPPQSCSLTNSTGTVPNGGVTNIVLSCGASNNWDQMNWDSGVWN